MNDYLLCARSGNINGMIQAKEDGCDIHALDELGRNAYHIGVRCGVLNEALINRMRVFRDFYLDHKTHLDILYLIRVLKNPKKQMEQLTIEANNDLHMRYTKLFHNAMIIEKCLHLAKQFLFSPCDGCDIIHGEYMFYFTKVDSYRELLNRVSFKDVYASHKDDFIKLKNALRL